MIRVALVDDQEVVRNGLHALIDSSSDMAVVGEASNGAEALSMLADAHADVVLMDINMPVMDGIEATRSLVESGSPTRVLVLTGFDRDEYAFAALKAGASGFLIKDTRPDLLLACIRLVSYGDATISPRIQRRLLDLVAKRLPGPGAQLGTCLDVLTDREHEVLLEIAHGASNAEICERLYMAEGTVKTHVGHLLAKLGCRDRVALVILAYETGLVFV